MKTNFSYDTATSAIAELQRQGFTIDFNIESNRMLKDESTLNDDYVITNIYRYEGDSDPADEIIIYAIESTTGSKGLLITAYGSALDDSTAQFIRKLLEV